MKSLSIALFFVFAISSSSFAQTKQDTIKVWGSCGMCKGKIEKAAKSAGAKSATWDVESHVLVLSYKTEKTDLKKIQESIAKVGYDTQDVTADNAAYDALHGCCKYDRKEASN
jgi:copper chaperone CopZ